ncbi:hypothetical protein BC938DRAFT_472923 [Jimgerdemannia flammicorona]|uniref:Uncharacterized protein n=1 Tax=Jimgerdemannia flammicorona TaxID=994334 RepID=A0A433Q549_9FUNG|nr:hypothetical protein BC938DRAFT_472923 [Jimgerdemannia flammicorona]
MIQGRLLDHVCGPPRVRPVYLPPNVVPQPVDAHLAKEAEYQKYPHGEVPHHRDRALAPGKEGVDPEAKTVLLPRNETHAVQENVGQHHREGQGVGGYVVVPQQRAGAAADQRGGEQCPENDGDQDAVDRDNVRDDDMALA